MSALRPGDVVAIPFRGVRHEGLVVAGGDLEAARVVHASKRRRRVVEEDARTFAAGRPVSVIGRAAHPPASVAYARAEVARGRRWTPLDNCQRFAREVSGLSYSSPDADRAGLLMVAAVAAAVLLRGRRLRRGRS